MSKELQENDKTILLENAVAREIVHEIMNYGVSQKQILQIINYLEESL